MITGSPKNGFLYLMFMPLYLWSGWLVGEFSYFTPPLTPTNPNRRTRLYTGSLGPFGNSQLKTLPIPWLAILRHHHYGFGVPMGLVYHTNVFATIYEWCAQIWHSQKRRSEFLPLPGILVDRHYNLRSGRPATERKIVSIVIVREIFTTFNVLVPAFLWWLWAI